MKLHKIGQILKSLCQVCSDFDKEWIKRKKKLNTLSILHILALQVWGKNGTKTAIVQLMNGNSLPKVSASACSQARQRLHWSFFRRMFMHVLSFLPTYDPKFLWQGRRVFAIDGSRVTMPHSFKAKKYMSPSKNSHYPQALLSVLYQLKAGVVHQVKLSRHFDERRSAKSHMLTLKKNDVLVLDRGFFL